MKIYKGQAIYLLRRINEVKNSFGDIINFISKNKDTISNVASAASSVADSVYKIGRTTIDTIKQKKRIMKTSNYRKCN